MVGCNLNRLNTNVLQAAKMSALGRTQLKIFQASQSIFSIDTSLLPQFYLLSVHRVSRQKVGARQSSATTELKIVQSRHCDSLKVLSHQSQGPEIARNNVKSRNKECLTTCGLVKSQLNY